MYRSTRLCQPFYRPLVRAIVLMERQILHHSKELEVAMTTLEKIELFNILLADDGTENMRAAIQFLADMPQGKPFSITSLRVFTPTEGSEFARVDAESQHTRNLLKSRHFHYTSEMVQGDPAPLILKHAEAHHPDLVVLGSKAVGKLGGLLGNVASDVVHGGKWPVLIARQPYNGCKRVLLATDGSEASGHTAAFLNHFPLHKGASLDILHVVPPVQVTYPIEPAGMAIAAISPEDEERINHDNLEHGAKILEAEKGMLPSFANITTHLMLGDPVEQILSFARAEQVDLLVCGSRGTGNLAGWLLGSISRDLVRRAPCSVLVVRNERFSAPSIP